MRFDLARTSFTLGVCLALLALADAAGAWPLQQGGPKNGAVVAGKDKLKVDLSHAKDQVVDVTANDFVRSSNKKIKRKKIKNITSQMGPSLGQMFWDALASNVLLGPSGNTGTEDYTLDISYDDPLIQGYSSVLTVQAEVPQDDCNGNGILDWVDITLGPSCDLNGNGVPDECEDAAASCAPPVAPVAIGYRTLLVSSSADPFKNEGNAGSFTSTVSADGRFVCFESDASDLVANDTNGLRDVFVWDRLSRRVRLVSVGLGGAPANGASRNAKPARDARFVVFESDASNLVAGDTNGATDVFLFDSVSGAITRLSVATGGGNSDGPSVRPSISDRGLKVAFESTAHNLVAGGTTGAQSQVFLRNLASGVTTLVSAASAQGNGSSRRPSVSPDGNFVAFESDANNLLTLADTNGVADVFLRNLNGGAVVRASVGSSSLQSNGASSTASVSFAGRFVLYLSSASNLDAKDPDTLPDVYLYDAFTQTSSLVGFNATTQAKAGPAGAPVFSGDGRVVAFESPVALQPAPLSDSNGVVDAYLEKVVAHSLARFGVGSSFGEASKPTLRPSLDRLGERGSFESAAGELDPFHAGAATSQVYHREARLSQVAQIQGLSKNQWFEVADNDLLDVTTALTIEAWVYPQSLGQQRVVLNKWGDQGANDRSYGVSLVPIPSTSTAAVRFALSDTAHQTDGTFHNFDAGVVPYDHWSHIACTYDKALQEKRIYVNGVLAGKTLVDLTIHKSVVDLGIGIGIQQNGGMVVAPFSGRLDEVRLWNVARSPAQIQSTLFRTYEPRDTDLYAGLIASWSFDDLGLDASEPRNGLTGIAHPVNPPQTDLKVFGDPARFAADCNENGADDWMEIQAAPNLDSNDNGALDACEGLTTTYCAQSQPTSIGGCVPDLDAVGVCSLTHTSGFTVGASPLPGGNNVGLLLYSTQGTKPPTNGAFGTFCLKGPIIRVAAGTGGGTNGACDGGFGLDFNAYLASHPGHGVSAGGFVDVQYWYRDPSSTAAAHFSEGGRFAVWP